MTKNDSEQLNHPDFQPSNNKSADDSSSVNVSESDLGLISEVQASIKDTVTQNPQLEESKKEHLLNHPPKAPKPEDEGKIPESQLPVLGEFTLISEISRSPNGVVYKARKNDFSNRIVALKIVSGENNTLDNKYDRFRQEISLVTSLVHPNIVPVFEVGDIEGWLYFTMAYIKGKSLAELIKDEPLPSNVAAKIVAKIAKGVFYANKKGIIHRDLKPSNILINSETNEPMIVDFGLAKDIKSDVKITQSGVAMGTPSYMPPEQARGEHNLLDSRSDVYSLGATLYELVTGKVVFNGETSYQILMKVVRENPTRPKKYVPNISPALEAIITKSLSKKQSKRYQNSHELANDLTKFIHGEWIAAKQNTVLNRFLNKIYSYRFFVYSLLAAVFVITIFLLSGYFRKEIDRNPEVKKLFEDQVHRQFKILNYDDTSENDDFWLHNEVWLDQSNQFFAQSFQQKNYAGIILKEPIKMTDFKLEFNLEFLPFENEEPNFSFFLTEQNKNVCVKPFFDPIISNGYLLTLGADQNSHSALYRNGADQYFDSKLKLRAEEYSVKIQVNCGHFIFEIQDSNRRIHTIEYKDDFPLAIDLGGYFGFITVKTHVILSNIKLSLISPPTDELERANRLFNLGLYSEASIDYHQKELFAEARKNDKLFSLARFKYLLCSEKIGDVDNEDFIEQILNLKSKIELYEPMYFSRILLESYYKTAKFSEFLIYYQNLLDRKDISRVDILRLLSFGFQLAECSIVRAFDLLRVNPANLLKTVDDFLDTSFMKELLKLDAPFTHAVNLSMIRYVYKNACKPSTILLNFAQNICQIIQDFTKKTSYYFDSVLHFKAQYKLMLVNFIQKICKVKNSIDFATKDLTQVINDAFLEINLLFEGIDEKAITYREQIYLMKLARDINQMNNFCSTFVNDEIVDVQDDKNDFRTEHWKSLFSTMKAGIPQ